MKKIISAILAILVLASFSISAFAADFPVYVEEIGISLLIPDDYDTITRSSAADNPLYGKLGVTKEYFDNHAQSNGIYFYALQENWEDEIQITAKDISYGVQGDFSALTDAEVETIYNNIKTATETNGGTVTAYEILYTAQAKYIRLYRNFAMDDIFEQMYYTVIDGIEYYITVSSYLGEVTADQETILRNVVHSLEFNVDSAPTVPVTEPVTEPLTEETEPLYEEDEYYYDEYDPEYDEYEDEYYYEEEDEGMPWWGWLLIGLAVLGIFGTVFVVILIVVIVVIVKKKKAKKAKAANTANPETPANPVSPETPDNFTKTE